MEVEKVMELFDSNLILFDVEVEDKEQLLKMLTAKLINKGYVKESFTNAVIEREKSFPTGLPTAGVKVALPHTRPEHVLKACILVANLKKPIIFKDMGSGVKDINAEMVFLLAVADPNSQIVVLKKMMEIFAKEEALKKLKRSTNPEDLLKILREELK